MRRIYFLIALLLLPFALFAEERKVVLITGASRGLGKAMALKLAASDHYLVYAGCRNVKAIEEKRDNLRPIALDVTNASSCHKAVQEILKQSGRIDVLVNNAGKGVLGPVEMVTVEQAQKLFDVNFFGAIRMLHEVLPTMREQKSGLIINVSSVVGLCGTIFWDLYSSSKFALEGLSESMAPSLSAWNIHVALIEPGPVNTNFMEESTTLGKRMGSENPYAASVEKRLQYLTELLHNGQTNEEIAELTQTIIEAPQPHFRYQTSDWVRTVAKGKLIDPTGDALRHEEIVKAENLFRSVPGVK